MMRLFIEGRQVDLSENEVLQVTREIADIREPSQRSSDWSRTFRIPGTSANNKLFGHIFDVNQEQLNNGTQFAPDFNPNKKAAALVTVDEVEQVRGYVRLLNISVVRKGQIEYEVSVHGQAADLFAKIRNKELADIDLSDLNHTLTRANIEASWSNTTGYVYPMINRGRTDILFANIWRVQDFYPAVFAKTLVDRIFSAAGYSYSADSFFNTDLFTRLVIPSPGVPQINEATVNSRKARAKQTANATYTEGQNIVFNDDTTAGFYDNGGNFDTSTGKYSSPTGGGRFSITGNLNVQITGLSAVTYPYLSMTVGVYVEGKLVEQYNPLRMVNGVGGAAKQFQFTINDVYADKSDKIDIRIIEVIDYSDTRMGEVVTGGIITVVSGSWMKVDPVQTSYGLDSSVDLNGIFSGGKWKQDEFLNGLIRMFNLYLEPTGRSNELYIAPRDTFYRNTVVHDLTDKIDHGQPLQITPMGELEGNPYVFTYAKGDDADSKDYIDSIGRVYGEARIRIDNEFVNEEKKVEPLFASTLYSTESSNNFRIAGMESADEKSGALRILYWSGKVGSDDWLLCDGYKLFQGPTGVSVITDGYPHAGHLDDPFTPSLDLSFGMPVYVNLPAGVTYTNNNLFNAYWKKYLSEITDRNSRIVKARVYVTPADWAKWSFRDLYFFGGQYFRLNKISDYQVGEAELTECEFLKIKNANVFTPQTKAAGSGYDIKDDNNDRFPNVRTRPIGKKKRFAWSTLGGSNEGGKGPIVDWTQGVVNLTYKDIGAPTTGDVYRPAIEWTGADWNVVLIKEV